MEKGNGESQFNEKTKKDVKVLVNFILIFCQGNHPDKKWSPIQAKGRVGELLKDHPIELCDQCRKLLLHAVTKRGMCPYDPKPRCKKCLTPCYGKGYRNRIKEVMRYSGVDLMKRGRIDLIFKYYF